MNTTGKIKALFHLKEGGLVKKSLQLSALSLLANVLGFLVPPYIAYCFGISRDTDDFFFSYALITFGGTIFSGAVKSVLVPFLVERKDDASRFQIFISTLYHFAQRNLLKISIALVLVLSALYLAKPTNFVLYLLLSVPILFFSVMNALFYGILNAMNQFTLAETSPFSRAVIIYLTIFALSPAIGISAVIIGYNLGEAAKYLHLRYVLKKKNGVSFQKQFNDGEEIRVFLSRGSVQAVSTTISSASPIIDKITASFLIAGSISMLDYGNKLFMVFNVLLNAFLTILLSKWAGEVAGKTFSLKKMHRIVGMVFAVSLLLLLVTGIGKELAVQLLYPTLREEDRELISWIFLLNMTTFLFSSTNQVINRATIAFKETGILVKTAVVKFILNIILNILFALQYGVIGIAVSTVLVNMVGVAVNYFLFIQLYQKEQRLSPTL